MARQKEKTPGGTEVLLCFHYSEQLKVEQEHWYSLLELLPKAMQRILLKSLNQTNES